MSNGIPILYESAYGASIGDIMAMSLKHEHPRITTAGEEAFRATTLGTPTEIRHFFMTNVHRSESKVQEYGSFRISEYSGYSLRAGIT